MGRLTEIADGVFVATSTIDATTTTVVVGEGGGCLVVDPAVTPAEVTALGNDLRELGLRAAVGWSTHAHWDHLLWNTKALGGVPRYATAKAADVAVTSRGKLAVEANKAQPGHDLAALGQVKPLPAGSTTVPWEGPEATVIDHNAHAPGHGALWFASLGLLVAGDMLSDVEVPILDLEGKDAFNDMRSTIDRFRSLDGVTHLVPGHGSPTEAAGFLTRIVRDRVYLNDLAAGRKSIDPRLTNAPQWMADHHVEQARMVAKTGIGLLSREEIRTGLS